MRKQRGLTLIELLAVIAIIAILFVLLIPQVTKAIDKARVSGVQVDLHSYEIGMRSYFMEHFGEVKTVEKLNTYLDKPLQFENINNKWVSKVEENPFGLKYELTSDWSTYMQVNSYTGEGPDARLHAVRVYEEGKEVKSMYIGFDEDKKKSDVDTTPPVIIVTPNGGEDVDNVFVEVTDNNNVKDIYYAWSTKEKYTDDQWHEMQGNTDLSTVFLGRGTYYLHIKARDTEMNTSNFSSNAYVLGDSELPMIILSQNGSTKEKFIHTTTISATDNKGVAKIEYAWSDVAIENQVITPWTEISNKNAVSTPFHDGQLYLHVKVTDTSGNVAYFISNPFETGDNEGPVITLSKNGNSVAQEEHRVVVTITDNDQVSSARYIWSDSKTAPTNGWTSITSGESVTTPKLNAILYLHVEATDRSGNKKPFVSKSFNTGDSEAPVITLSKNGSGIAEDEHTVVITITDNVQVSSARYVWSDSKTAPTTGWASITSGASVTTPKLNANLYLHVEATDRVGNKTTYVSRIFNTGDKEMPKVSFSPSGINAVAANHSTTITATDNKGIKKLEYVWAASKTPPTNGWQETTSGTKVTSPTEENNFYLHARVEDTYGNVTNLTSGIFRQLPYTYTLNSDKATISITGYNGTNKDIIIPSEIEGLAVTKIGNAAFSGKTVTSVVLPDTVETIDKSAFRNAGLERVTLSKNLKIIEEYAFYGNVLTKIEFPDSVELIEIRAFSKNQLESVKLPKNLTMLAERAFLENKINSLEINESLSSISYLAFGFNELTELKIPSTIKAVSGTAFSNSQIKTIQNCSAVDMQKLFPTATVTSAGC